MRSSMSSHHLSYRTKEWLQPGGPGCLTLNCKLVLNLLRAVLDENSHEAESSTAAGQKRPHPLSYTASRKRRNVDSEQSGVHCPPNESIPALRHEFNLQYSKECPEVRPYAQLISDNEAEEDGLTSAEEALVLFLRNSFTSRTEPITLDCGDVLINSHGEHGVTVDAKPSRLEEQWADLCNIFVLPSLYAEGTEGGDGHLFSSVDTLTRGTVRQSAVELTACLRMVVLPLISWDETLHTLPFRLVVDVILSFYPPAIFQPFTNLLKGKNRTEIEKARRSLLDLAFPPPSLPQTLSPSFHGRIDVPFLYAIAQPASAILQEPIDKSLQPQALLPTLLPFQRRTISWMLSREGKALDSSGELISMVVDPTELPVLWQRVIVQRDGEPQLTWYYHRLTGTLTPERPRPWTPMGGILAEEPGLGKTLECIALILLNPGIERSLSHIRWDPEARMTIREIRVYFIFTFRLRDLR
jgi:E3 ubiquitin-protein ligase SHPRH